MPVEVMPYWEGCDLPTNGRIVEARARWNNQKLATDYDRAGDAWDSACGEVFSVGELTAYVPTCGQQISVFEACRPSEQLLIEIWAWDEELTDEAFGRMAWEEADKRDACEWKLLGEMHCPSGEVWGFHAAYSGREVLEDSDGQLETPFCFHLTPGTYQLLYCEWRYEKWDKKNGLIWMRRKEEEN